jgi:hypothetical protein
MRVLLVNILGGDTVNGLRSGLTAIPKAARFVEYRD